ncbi:MAG: CbbQ/NirQ/NorQ/GpvN family protein [Betaproteobacteria bacterium]|jgi:cobaltochelatase CobS|nr:CbbQ/NirQ/NorQ/GpvN family protein [Betaproteobacteria bacterium]
MLAVGDGSHPNTPEKHPDYVFRRDLVRDMITFENNPRYRGMAFRGHAGCGKTTAVEQFYAYRGLPLHMLTATGTATAEDLVGGYHPTENGGLKYVIRSLLTAMQEGQPILLDEYNNFSAETTLAINNVLEGKAFHVEATGELIKPAPGFKIYVAMNDDTGLGIYNGRKKQDISNNDRFWWQRVTYPTPEEETKILTPIFKPSVPDDRIRGAIITGMVNVARKIRDQFIGDEQTGGDKLEVVLSTRSLVRWAELACDYAAAPQPLVYAFERAFGNSPMPESNREAIYTICRAELGAHFTTTTP